MLHKLTVHLPTRYRAWASWASWTVLSIVTALLVTTLALRSYSVNGISMEPTLKSGDVLLVNKLGRTLAQATGQLYIPARGSLVVFKNPFFNQGDPHAFVVKRVIGLPGDRVVVRDGRITVYSAQDPATGFNPDDQLSGPQSPTSGNVDRIVPEGEIFVAGDNRQGENSLDSRNGMSTVPSAQLEGTVLLRFWPLTSLLRIL